MIPLRLPRRSRCRTLSHSVLILLFWPMVDQVVTAFPSRDRSGDCQSGWLRSSTVGTVTSVLDLDGLVSPSRAVRHDGNDSVVVHGMTVPSTGKGGNREGRRMGKVKAPAGVSGGGGEDETTASLNETATPQSN
jgi:hypothetical protein